MLLNYLRVAWRNILKHRAFTLINVVGLSLSMSVCLVLILLIYDHYQFDTFHSKRDNIYRIISYPRGDRAFGEGMATTTLALRKELEGKYSSITDYATLNMNLMGELKSENKIVNLDFFAPKGLYADDSFFDMFGFTLEEGDEATALAAPNSMILTKEMSELLFPEGDPIGKMITYDDHTSFKVTGILGDPPGKSHINFQVLASYSTIPSLVEKEKFMDDYDTWDSNWSNYNYLLLNDPSEVSTLETEINKIAQANQKIDERNQGYDYELQSINDIVPGQLLGNEISYALPGIVLIGFAILGVIVIVTASINYANLSVAKSLSRAREIGIRKANGALRHQIVSQFLVEAIFVALLSLGGAVLIYRFLLDQVNSMWIFSQIKLNLTDTAGAYLFFVLFTLTLGIVTGIGPSLFLSKLDTIRSLKGSALALGKKKNLLARLFPAKKIMLSIQFALAFIMLISIFLIREQSHYFIDAGYGFDENKVQFVALQGNDKDKVQTEFGSIPGVENLSFTSHHPAVGRSHGDDARRTPEDEFKTLFYFSVDENYIDVMNLNLIAGSNFPEVTNEENEKFLILNEKALEKFEFTSASEAIGQTLTLEEDDEEKTLQIIGVVADYNWEPLMKDIRPLALRYRPDNYQFAYFRMASDITDQTNDRFEATWQEFDPSRDYEGGALAAELDIFYQFMKDLGAILSYIALLAIVITSLGFLGMVSFELKSKTKEIGIRKVLGAQFGQLLVSTTKGFIMMLAVTALLAIPAAIALNSLWLFEMANHVDFGITNVGPAILIVAVLCLATIWSQVWTNTRANPAHTLRNE